MTTKSSSKTFLLEKCGFICSAGDERHIQFRLENLLPKRSGAPGLNRDIDRRMRSRKPRNDFYKTRCRDSLDGANPNRTRPRLVILPELLKNVSGEFFKSQGEWHERLPRRE